MKASREIYYQGLKLGRLDFQTSATLHSLIDTDELALAVSLGAQAAGDCLAKILDAKGEIPASSQYRLPDSK